MLRMTKQADYSVVLLTRMAEGRDGASHSARDLAAEAHLPLPIVSKILKLLTREGLLVSQRGVRGGYTLARGADAISIAEIITAVDGPIALTECAANDSPSCGIEDCCTSRPKWARINRAIRRTLEGITLAEMAGPLAADEADEADGHAAPEPATSTERL